MVIAGLSRTYLPITTAPSVLRIYLLVIMSSTICSSKMAKGTAPCYQHYCL